MDFLLCTINARYQHASLGLRYLYANLGAWQSRTQLCEFTLEQSAEEIVEKILAHHPRAVGFGVYIWNVALTLETIQCLKKVRPEIKVVVGGPEVSHEIETQPLFSWVDTVIPGEAEHRLAQWCEWVLGKGIQLPRVLLGPPPEISDLKLPYALYTDEDLAHRVVYVEASRGCAYRCEFCLSALDEKVRAFDLDLFLAEMKKLLERGLRQFKFVDRTFNLKIETSAKILDFFLAHQDLGLFLHFEMVPERLPEELKTRIKRFRPGSLQFEVGIQTWNPEVSRGISRPQNYEKVAENLRYLHRETHTHLHTDLIVGLPGEDLTSFGRGFDELLALGPHEIQVGILKRLRGMPLNRQTESAGLVFSEEPPYAILQTNHLSFGEVQRLKRFAKFWDLIANRGQFPRLMEQVKLWAKESDAGSVFQRFIALSDFMASRHPKLHSIGLPSLAESLWHFGKKAPAGIALTWNKALAEDYSQGGKRSLPGYLALYEDELKQQRHLARTAAPFAGLPERQRRHLENQVGH